MWTSTDNITYNKTDHVENQNFLSLHFSSVLCVMSFTVYANGNARKVKRTNKWLNRKEKNEAQLPDSCLQTVVEYRKAWKLKKTRAFSQHSGCWSKLLCWLKAPVFLSFQAFLCSVAICWHESSTSRSFLSQPISTFHFDICLIITDSEICIYVLKWTWDKRPPLAS